MIKIILPVAFLSMLAATLINIACSARWLKIGRVTLDFYSLPESFDGFRILHISDLHSRSDKKTGIDIWKAVDGLEFDIVVMTGDMVLSRYEQLFPYGEGLRLLAEKVPVYFVGGNHERRVYAEAARYLKSLGVIVLSDETVTIARSGETINITGLKNRASLGSYKPRLSDTFTIILEHQPQLFNEIEHDGEFLMLSGHTHGGQVRFPLLPTLYAPEQGLFPHYSHGVYRHGSGTMYISRGIGATDFNIRFFNRPEITVLTLKLIKN